MNDNIYYINTNNNNNLYNKTQSTQSAINATATTLCSICMTNYNNQINTVCWYMSVCRTCLPRIGNICPICRQIGNYIQVYNTGIGN